eukprot:6558970-Prymnesium_polylepis.1
MGHRSSCVFLNNEFTPQAATWTDGRTRRRAALSPRQTMSDDAIASLSIKELRALIAEAGLSTEGCLDKNDLRERAAEAQRHLATRSAVPAATPSLDGMALEDVLTALEEAISKPPGQEAAERASACLEQM